MNIIDRLLIITFFIFSLSSCRETVRTKSGDSIWSSPYRVDKQYPHHLINNEGRHLFIFNKTAWAYFLCKNPENVLIRAKRDGANVIRVALEGDPYYNVLHMDMWPWGGTREAPQWDKFNTAYWDQVEERVKMALGKGIGINLTLYFTYKPAKEDAPAQILYWKEILRRLAKYPNILCWEIMNEYVKNEDFQDIAGTWFHENDPDQRPVISSAGTTDDAVFPDKPWMDMAVVHTCTGSTPQYDLKWWYQNIAQNTMSYGKPAFNNESGREIRHKNDDGVHRRKQAWLWSSSGAFFTFHTLDGCEAIDSVGYKAPGYEFMKPYSDFFSSIPYHTLYANYTVCTIRNDSLVIAGLASPNRSMSITYVCTRQSGKNVTGEKARIRLPDGLYSIVFIEPATLSVLGGIEYESGGLSETREILLPEFKDDILIKIVLAAQKEKTLIEGTK
jgi:hypothetical protein